MFRVNSLRVFLCYPVLTPAHKNVDLVTLLQTQQSKAVSPIPSNAEKNYSFQLGTNLLASHNSVLLTSAAEHFNQFYLAYKHVDTLRPFAFQLYQLTQDLLLLQPVLWYVAVISEDKLYQLCGDLD